jgi:hypothetical protein
MVGLLVTPTGAALWIAITTCFKELYRSCTHDENVAVRLIVTLDITILSHSEEKPAALGAGFRVSGRGLLE